MPGSPAPPESSPSSGRSAGTRIARLLVVGVLAGLASGLFGVGGGIVIVPGLVIVTGYDQRTAHGTSLAAIVPIAAAGTIGYATAGEVDLTVALLMSAGAIVGTPLGVAALARIPQRALRLAFAGLLVVTAVRLVLDVGGNAEGLGRGAVDVAGALGYAAVGLVSGVVAGLMGVGGGIVLVPVLTIVFGFPLVLAKGTSLAVIVPSSLVGTLRNLRQSTVDLRGGMLVGVGGVVTAALASQLSLQLDRTVSAWSFAILLVVVGIRMVLRVQRTATR